MLLFFGQFETEKELETAMINTFRTNPDKYLKALAKRVIAQDMKCASRSSSSSVTFGCSLGAAQASSAATG
jgi:hypothetical protein